ncbi:hypothetical protein E2C01_075484 [Portunus trituberculatus]|uniref:Uncharacterized protein n=1 Tax=Portunus trituberculatus TaxID=210409 RepID=A0A5B7IH59_PORTR|nr:hypothetical protein [Portunus trituberculatus]
MPTHGTRQIVVMVVVVAVTVAVVVVVVVVVAVGSSERDHRGLGNSLSSRHSQPTGEGGVQLKGCTSRVRP